VSKQSLLLVDGDTRSMRVLEVSLRKAGFTVTTATSARDALDKLELDAPDLIISETTFPDGNGFELRRRVRAMPEWAEIPFIFLTAEAAIENKIRGLELGVDDYLTKPIYIKEIVTRINILLQKRQRARFEERRDGRTRFAGRVQDMPVVDVIQTIEISRKSGVIQFVGDRGRQAAIYFRDGRVIDAEAGTLTGEDAVYRLLTWSEGEFEVVFRTVRRREVITTSSQGLLMEGMRRLDEWSRLLEQLPPLTHRFEVDPAELALRLGDVPDDNNAILRLIDGKRTLLEVIDASDVGDLECLQAIGRLYFEELLVDLDHDVPARRDTGKPVPLVEVDVAGFAFEESASGPIELPETLASPPSPDAQVTDVTDVLEEEAAPGALLGGYRPSSLRLIDEAVAAAQAIEPVLFEDDAAVPSSSHDAADSIPHPIDNDPEQQPPVRFRGAARATPHLEPEPVRDEVSGLRMIGSQGRDRAETSGEVMLGMARAEKPRAEAQRELVTILPRRTTREIPVVAPASDDPPSATSTIPADSTNGVSSVTAREAEPAPARTRTPNGTGLRASEPALARTRTPSGPPRAELGSGVRRAAGPGPGAMTLLVLAGLLAVLAVYLYLRRGTEPEHRDEVAPSAIDASLWTTVDATAHGEVSPDASRTTSMPPSDAAITVDAESASDASAAPRAERPITARSTRDELNAQAKQLYEQALEALQENEIEQALRSADASLALRKTARTHIVRARALQRLDRLDDGLAALAEAETIARPYGGTILAYVLEWKARVLRSARRLAEAREVMREYLAIKATGAVAGDFRAWLDENP
jgi:DNA-binding response OmpR family regulator